MTIADPIELLRDHVGHHLVLIEPAPGRIALKCRSTTCPGYNRNLDLTNALGHRPTASAAVPARSKGDPKPDQECPLHVGEFSHNCRPCIADRKGIDPENPPPPRPRGGADPRQNAAWQAARAALSRPNDPPPNKDQP